MQRTPKFAAARGKLGRYALSPSKLFGDTSVWTAAAGPSARVLELETRYAAGQYLFAPRAGARAPEQPGDARHVMRLTRQGDGVYQWATSVEYAVGQARAAAIADVFGAALSSMQRPDLKGDTRAAFPRTSVALGRLFTLDSARSIPQPDGSSLVFLRVSLHSDRLKPAMPAFAQYVDKYVAPARYKIALADGRGGRWLDARADDNVLTFRLRTRGGQLVALEGAPRPMPDSLQLHVDAFAKFLMFEVGVTKMVADFVNLRGDHERGWSMRFRRPPDWHFPLGANHLIRSSLKRPFSGNGMLFRLAVRDADPRTGSTQTTLVRRLDVTVEESAIVRWLGGLGASAMSDFAGRAEVEENRFTADALQALRADVRALAGDSAD